jgi:long-subunit acyl-CoA synthetase (AMP-forming)
LISDLAIQTLGCADVPRGCDSLGNEIRFIISFADCRYGFFENARQLKKVTEKIQEVPLLTTAILFDPLSKEDEEQELPEEGEVPFPEILGEEHNYVVLYFDNEVDWLQAQTLFDIQPTLALSTRKDGKITESMRKKVVGRVVNGAKALEAIRSAMQ